MDIVGGLDAQGIPRCDCDSRLYLRPTGTVQLLPLGLVEQLTEVHHVWSESLRDLVIAVASTPDLEPPPLAPPGTAPHFASGPGISPAFGNSGSADSGYAEGHENLAAGLPVFYGNAYPAADGPAFALHAKFEHDLLPGLATAPIPT